MTENEWLTSTDPRAMLQHLLYAPSGTSFFGEHLSLRKKSLISGRKLRLWVVAGLRRAAEPESYRHVDLAERRADGLLEKDEIARLRAWSHGNDSRLARALREPVADGATVFAAGSTAADAHSLRCIAGNPLRPSVVLPRDLDEVLDRGAKDYRQENVTLDRCLTPDVRSLALAAYEKRPELACPRHETSGFVGHVRGNERCAVTSARLGRGGRPECTCRPEDCPDCGGSGKLLDGGLDPDRLAVLSDALEEAGCTDVALLEHLRGVCPSCHGRPEIDYDYRDNREVWCYCAGFDWAKRGRLPRGHVRGCWAVDLCLGRT